ncbi:actin-like [Microcaecilia unicolor]|uniref:Actin-like n=1 Tax=Microcaecilia unicolor TaxID=1415580 RepID=A0A6P7ZMR1_9AMPH|nr:actin-like [Microcaecilia unicolor]
MSTLIGKEYPFHESNAVVLDMGSGSCKAGYSGAANPSSIVDSVVGYTLKKSLTTGEPKQETWIGRAARMKSNLMLVEFLKDGAIADWEAIENLWRYILYKELEVLPEKHAVLLSDSPYSPITQRETMAEILFEYFNVPAMHVAHRPVLEMYSYGCTTALVVHSGSQITQAVPVHEGYILPHAIEKMDLAGLSLTTYLQKRFQKAAPHLNLIPNYIMDDVKHKCCYIALDFKKELNLYKQNDLIHYKLPDGHVLCLGKERYKCPETLFTPSVFDVPLNGIHYLVASSLKKIPSSIKEEVFKNILLSGGSTMFKGFCERFCKEVQNVVSDTFSPMIYSVPERKDLAWKSGKAAMEIRKKEFQIEWLPYGDLWLKRNALPTETLKKLSEPLAIVDPGASEKLEEFTWIFILHITLVLLSKANFEKKTSFHEVCFSSMISQNNTGVKTHVLHVQISFVSVLMT